MQNRILTREQVVGYGFFFKRNKQKYSSPDWATLSDDPRQAGNLSEKKNIFLLKGYGQRTFTLEKYSSLFL